MPHSQPRKFQVFVSSTFGDLQKERQAAVMAILKANHIPAGMELFAAGDKSQMDVIKKWIDESDIYLLILGGRYGSIEPESQKSYIELEYDYAVKKKKPFFACVIHEAHLKKYPTGSPLVEQDYQEKLRHFRQKVLSRMSRLWRNEDQIQVSIMETLAEFSKRGDLKGWIKDPGDNALTEMLRLYNENVQLRDECNGKIAMDRYFQFMNHKQAFSRVTSLIREYIKKDQPDHIELKFMGVAMRFSSLYLQDVLTVIASKNPEVNFLCKFAFTNSKHLERLILDTTDCDWTEQAKDARKKLLDLESEYKDKCEKEGRKCNLRFIIAIFDEIPQRHGILLKLDNEHLFLGVSDWDMGGQYPRLTVGTNRYRHHDSTQEEGRFWIDLFKHWFLFYQKYQDNLKEADQKSNSSEEN